MNILEQFKKFIRQDIDAPLTQISPAQTPTPPLEDVEMSVRCP